MRKSLLFTLMGLSLGLAAPIGALFLLWLSPHPSLQLPYFIEEEWRDHLFFFTYMLVGTSFSFGLFGLFLGRSTDVIEDHNRHLSLLATHDELTGLGNHRFLHETFKIEFRKHLTEHRPISCLMMDLDHFKRVNDAYGHPFGDYVLKHFGALVRKSIRTGDIAARYGGEEFLCILPDCEVKEAHEVAERIRRETERYPFLYGNRRVPVTVSIGTATYFGPADKNYHLLIAAADRALYKAKNRGRNRVVQQAPDKAKKASRSKTGRAWVRNNNGPIRKSG
jgi:diguanylate cyclase (GGDEF)-like protein